MRVNAMSVKLNSRKYFNPLKRCFCSSQERNCVYMPHVDQKSIECGELKRSRKERSNGREGVPQPDALRVQGANMRLKTS